MSDAGLVAAAVEGDAGAWAALVGRHGPRLWGLCRRLAPDAQSAEDAYQATWERALAALPRWRHDRPEALASWLGTICHRLLIDRHRRKKVRGLVLPFDGTGTPELVSPGPAPDELSARAQRLVQLDQALRGLPEDQRRVVVLHHLQGVPLSELAATEGVAVGTIKSRLHRGRARLAQALLAWAHQETA